MIDLQEVEVYHNGLIDQFGGSKGIRDIAGLEAALARPYMTFDQQDLYPTAVDKAAAIFESLIINHPFIDGNKRIAYLLLRLTVRIENITMVASQKEKYDMAIAASMGEIHFDQIKDWIAAHSIKVQ
ncbi:type II toxin-antitoxin system death-on-curing family toxin [Mucilaginibacter psychrotolerans]|uniref:Type II toxin-antitoxin system death-on-curing family toxin n=1 Tax=Mucilaginibacter psychrotolerans TaxID=1524096 RepID=A0A4Y8SC61_9SPHI|nr:type II toxin-antitoxin system death-on-curing family toxin [Mucilaginibacter psychrotolerans]TFF35936.1 type II toxin-antitoxin system death-on-curing family toxin [Mucilaginibacter psychrotolerans]